MKTPYTNRWIPLDILHALGPEDEDAELRAWVSAELDDPATAPSRRRARPPRPALPARRCEHRVGPAAARFDEGDA